MVAVVAATTATSARADKNADGTRALCCRCTFAIKGCVLAVPQSWGRTKSLKVGKSWRNFGVLGQVGQRGADGGFINEMARAIVE